MTQSYKQIDYRLRPAKNVERKMIVESLRRLYPFQHVSSYRYIGFGSLPFVDFLLMHRSLDISDMTSIEGYADSQKRFEFNKPLGCIDLQFGVSTDVLLRLDWTHRAILWLDYDGELERSILADIEMVATKARSGTILIVSVNARPGDPGGRVERVMDLLGEDVVPDRIQEPAHLGGWKKADLYWELIDDRIRSVAQNRSAAKAESDQVDYHQLFHVRYADNAQMLTVGGVFVSPLEHEQYEQCGFASDRFIRTGNEPFLIEVPIVTPRELLYVLTKLPCDDTSTLGLDNVPPGEVAKLARIYRHYPAFVEADI